MEHIMLSYGFIEKIIIIFSGNTFFILNQMHRLHASDSLYI